MGIVVEPGITIGAGITLGGGFVPSATLVYDLDAANYSAVPVNGTKAVSYTHLTLPTNREV